jgi:hypothetical protein
MGSTLQNVATGPRRPHSIRLKLRDINQLFNLMDPSPFIEKDLDDDAEEFIVGWAQEFPPDAPVGLHVELEQWLADDPTELVTEAVHHHFAHKAELTDLEFSALLKQGRVSLLIGASCLAVCLGISRLLLNSAAGTWASILKESLTIAGWVAMWRPMQIYLYDWWPLRRRSKIYARLSRMPVEVVPKARSRASADNKTSLTAASA